MTKRCTYFQPSVWIKNDRNQLGFTLLEVLCSLVIMGLVVVASLSFLGHSLDFWEKSGRWGRDDQIIRQVDRNLTNFAGRLYSGHLPHGEEQGFLGDDYSVEGLVAEEDGLMRIGLFWDASQKTLYSWRGSREERTEIAGNIDSFKLSYYESEKGWVSSWDEQSPLPTHIQINWKYQSKKEPPLMLSIIGGRNIPAP